MPKRGENIRKRKDGRWEGRYNTGKSPTGKQTYISVYGKTYNEVKSKLLDLSQRKPEPKIIGKTISIGEVIREWQANNRMLHKGATEAKYEYLINTHILPAIENLDVKNVTADYLNSFAESKLKSGRLDKSCGLSASYVRTIMIILSSVMKYATEEQYCLPLKGKIFKPSIEKTTLDIFDESEQKLLESYLFSNISLTNFGILVSLYMGLRIGEICALTWDNIDFENKIIHITGTVSRVKNTDENSKSKTQLIIDKPKTETSNRIIPIPSKLFPLFKEFYQTKKSKFVLSESPTFLNPRTYEYRYHAVLKKCGIQDKNYHSLRHTFATRYIEVGVDVKTLSELLGHADVSITLNTYVHSSLELKRKQIEKLCTISGQ